MIRSLILRKLAVEERRMGVPLDYLRHILRVSLRSFFVFTKIMPISNHRRTLPPEPYFLARLVAARAADCGTCVQIEVNLALQEGVGRDVLAAVVEERPNDLSNDLETAYRFADSVVSGRGDDDELRQKIVAAFGEKGLVELALAIAVAGFFPVTKRALGYAKSCSQVQIEV